MAPGALFIWGVRESVLDGVTFELTFQRRCEHSLQSQPRPVMMVSVTEADCRREVTEDGLGEGAEPPHRWIMPDTPQDNEL